MARDSNSSHKLTLKDGPNPGQEFELTNSEIIIDGDQGADINLSSTFVSRRHAHLAKSQHGYIIEDLGSSNGTFVNDRKISQPYVLAHGDKIRLGQTIFLIYESSAKLELEPPSGVAETIIGEEIQVPSLENPAKLILTKACDNPQSYDLAGASKSIGMAEENDIVIPSQIVSRHHPVLHSFSIYTNDTLIGEVDPSDPPSQPYIPPPPIQPEDLTDTQAVEKYPQEKVEYDDMENQINANYRARVDAIEIA